MPVSPRAHKRCSRNTFVHARQCRRAARWQPEAAGFLRPGELRQDDLRPSGAPRPVAARRDLAGARLDGARGGLAADGSRSDEVGAPGAPGEPWAAGARGVPEGAHAECAARAQGARAEVDAGAGRAARVPGERGTAAVAAHRTGDRAHMGSRGPSRRAAAAERHSAARQRRRALATTHSQCR